MKRPILVVLAAGVLLAAAKPEKKAPAKLEGAWTVTAAVRDGKENEEIVGHMVTFTGDKFTIKNDGTLIYEGTFKLGSGKVSTIDFTHTGGKAEGKIWKGIWQRKGATLQICDNAPDTAKDRPKAFASKAGSGYALVTLKRSK